MPPDLATLPRNTDARAAQMPSPENNPAQRVVGDDYAEAFLSVRTLHNQYLDYLDSKTDEIEEAKGARRYYHCAQLTAEQYKVLQARHQPVQIWPRIHRRINGIVGMIERMRCDPKAVGRNPKSEEGAEIATQAIRYVLDANQFKDTVEFAVLLQAGIEGVAGVQLVLQKGDKGDPDVGIHPVIGDEYFYDPRSYQFNFKDNRYEGIAKWLDLEAAVEMFPDKRDVLEGLFQGDSDLTTNSDREVKWIISTNNKRLRIVEHWYKHRGKWRWAFYCANVLLEQGVSPFFDDEGESASSFEMFSAAIDQDGDRYAFVRAFRGPQDALNQGKSKTLALANSRRIILEKGAVDDVETARREVARHDGLVEVNPNKQFKVDDTHPDIAVFTAFTDDAKKEMDGFANADLAAMMGPGGVTNVSGKALEILRQPGMAELGPFVLAHRSFKLALYRKIWNTVQRHWTRDRWIRVTSNDKLAHFIQINGVDLDQWGRPVMINAVGALDVNIVLDMGPDLVSMQEETYDMLKGYPPGTFPPQVLIEMNPNLPRSDKDRLLQMMAPKPPQADPAAEVVKHLQLEAMAGRNAKLAADTHKTLATAEQASATAEQKRASIGHSQADLHLAGAEFLRDTLNQAQQIARPAPPPQAPQQVQPAGV